MKVLDYKTDNRVTTYCRGLDGRYMDDNGNYTNVKQYIDRCKEVGDILLDKAVHLEHNSKRGCAGLACNQLGITDVRVFVSKIGADVYKNTSGRWTIFAEPYTHTSSNNYYAHEGCLSVKNKKHHSVLVLRWDFKELRYLDLTHNDIVWKWVKLNEDFNRWESQVFQHEIDHLNGETIIDNNNLYLKGAKFVDNMNPFNLHGLEE